MKGKRYVILCIFAILFGVYGCVDKNGTETKTTKVTREVTATVGEVLTETGTPWGLVVGGGFTILSTLIAGIVRKKKGEAVSSFTIVREAIDDLPNETKDIVVAEISKKLDNLPPVVGDTYKALVKNSRR